MRKKGLRILAALGLALVMGLFLVFYEHAHGKIPGNPRCGSRWKAPSSPSFENLI